MCVVFCLNFVNCVRSGLHTLRSFSGCFWNHLKGSLKTVFQMAFQF